MQRILYKITFLSLLFSLYNCGNKESQTTQNEVQETANNFIKISQAQFEQNKMTLGNLEEKQFPTIINVNGMIDVPPENKAVVSATMGGYIKNMPLLVGDKIKKGQLLATIENPEFVTLQQEYMEVNAQLTYLKSEFERQKTMVAEKITSQKSFLKAESDYKTAVATYNGLRQQLRMLNISPATVEKGTMVSVATIYAPISGSITKVNVTKGTYVSPAMSILEIIDNDHIHLELSVFEKDIMNVKKGQQIDFKIPEATKEIFKAEVHLVGTSIEQNRTIKVHGHIEDDENHNFLTGMFIDANIITNTTLAKAIPSEAIVVVDEVSYVLVLDKKEGKTYYFIQKEVVVDASYNGYSIIKNSEAFTSNTQFLTKGAFNLLGE
ncbi:Cobalt-zinc-cadmium resistance protein CzcB [Kordia antarctica]|uniref:Cobalt-zinc-cadmium resistance protein CzcB n=1 Tax=Kordia antarctica TaxID=1218801 RepID=A0A7L4ZHP5_9FLAO|nr:efflux RND transporter periplasmic adaptor subunit [Kordia antarctica]QHI36253.1 Cobalt-zinc-cadmium resistance protein CzcB [Kordia antarctica]